MKKPTLSRVFPLLLTICGVSGSAFAQIATTTVLTASPNPATAASNVTFTAIVLPQTATNSAPTGNVEFTGLSGNVYTIPVVNGSASLILQLPMGSYKFTAKYGGDSTFSASPSSNAVIENILNATTVNLGVSPNPATYGQRVTLTANVNPASATGTVTFYDRQNIIGVGELSNGTATFSTTQLPSGERLVTARYSGDVSNAPSSTGNSVNATIVAQTGYGLSSPHVFPTGTSPVFAASGDFNNDGLTDVVVANSGNGSVSVFLGDGDGTLAPPRSYVVGSNPQAVAVADFNRDGIADLAVASADGVDILLGNGDGTFAASTPVATGSATVALLVLDLNKDGIADLVAGNSGSAQLSTLLGNGDGTFQPATTTPVPANPGALAVGDFNFDGKPDVAVVSSAGVSTLFGNGDGTFATATTYATGAGANAILVKDLNGDSNQDLIVTNGTDGTISVLLGAGGGTFRTQMTYSAGSNPNSIASTDFNGDGKLDLVITNAASGANVAVLLGNGDGSFKAPIGYEADPDPASALVVELNGDGKPDIAVVSQVNNAVDVLLNGFPSLALVSGNNQSTPINGVFAQSLQVSASSFGQPAPAISVTFHGSAGTFSGSGSSATVLTNAAGVATAPIYFANGIVGSDTVTATAGGNTVTFNLTNAPQACSFSVSPQSAFFDANGGATSFSVVASGPACVWGAGSASSSIVVGNSSGTGSGTVYVLASPNSTGSAITSTLLVAGQPVSITVQGTVAHFSDVTPSAFYFDFVNNMAAKGITTGCSANPPDYCPDQSVTRAQMAIFVVRAVYGGDNFTLRQQTPYFADVPQGSFGYQWIQKMYELGITSGCDSVPDYCPDQTVTRAQMAVFIMRARYGASAQLDYPSTPYFSDAPSGSFAFSYIQRMAFDGITQGCGAGKYCPDDDVTRGEMAVFVMRALFNEFAPTTPILVSVSPATLTPGTPTTVTVTGANTHFIPGTTVVNPIPGVTVGSVTVVNPNELQVVLTDNGSADQQPESVWVSTGSEEVVLPNHLTVP